MSDQVADPIAEVECGIGGCEFTARPWSSLWAYHYESDHKDRIVTRKIVYAEDGCDLCGARRMINGPVQLLHKGDCRG